LKARAWIVLLVVLAAVAVGAWRLLEWRNQPPPVAFARAARETITSSVSTNGKAEPVEWALARAERSGAAARILVEKGQSVARDQPLVEIDSADARADLAAAEARISAARAELELIERGGRATDLAEIASAADQARLAWENARRDHDTLVRLQARQAATKTEVDNAKERLDAAYLRMKAADQRRAALVAPADRPAAEARLRDGETAAQAARARIRMSVVRAPIQGAVYQFDLKPGAYLNAGDVVASIGRLERIHVNVYVDEPDLGRVDRGMPVVITWDALPGRQWNGVVENMPTQVVALGARQVGEVVCTIRNPSRDLPPGANVTAEIRSQTAENAVTIPKETIRRQNGRDGVWLLEGGRLAWRAITIGVNNSTRAQVMELQEGDALALPTERDLRQGMLVRPVFP
jgi:HlyD family secretion protein